MEQDGFDNFLLRNSEFYERYLCVNASMIPSQNVRKLFLFKSYRLFKKNMLCPIFALSWKHAFKETQTSFSPFKKIYYLD